MEDKALTHIFNDIYGKVLQLSENPSQFAEYLTLQIRELIGTRTVVFAIKTETGQPEIFSVYPGRRKEWANQSTVIKLAELSFNFDKLQFLDREKCDKACSLLLQSLEIEKAIAIPLITGNRKIGSILLLDIMDTFGIDSVLYLLEKLSGLFALVIRNAYLYSEMENQVLSRTEELRKQNEQLQQNEEELQSLNEEYLVINEELSETLKIADELNLTLKESEERYKSLVNNIPVGVFRSNIQGEVLSANPAMAEIYGYASVEDLLKVRAKNYYSELNPREEMLVQLREKGFLLEYETQEYKKNGSLIWVSSNYRLINKKYSDNTVESYIDGVVTDVTESKLAEEALLKSEERFDLAMKASNDGLFDWNLETNEIYYSPGWKKMLGYKDHELPNDFSIWENLTKPEDVQRSWELQQKLINKQIDRFVMEFKMKHKNGHWVDILSRAEAIFNRQGKAIRIVGTHTDISDRKKGEIILRENEEKYRLLHENAGLGIGYYKPDGTVISYNRIASKDMGGEPEDFAGKSIYDLFPKAEAGFYYKRIEKACLMEEPVVYEDKVALPKEEKYFLSTYSKITDSNNQILGIQVISQNITETKKAQIELIAAKEKAEESELQFKQLFESEADAVFIADVENGIILDVNRAGEKLMQMQKNEIIGLHQSDLHPENIDEFSIKSFTEHKQSIEKMENAVLIENKIVRKDGVEVPVEILASKVRFKGKECLIGTFRDITERKKAEEALRKSEEMIVSSQSVANICSYSTTLNENELEKSTWICSPQFYNIFGIDETYPHTIAGWVGFIHPDYRDKLAAYHEYVVKNKTSFNHQYKIIRINDGVERWVEGTGKLEYDTQGNPIRMYGAIQDITERKKVEKDLIEAKLKAEESDRLKSAFLANMSHEIRTPMNGILGFTSLLQEPDLTGKQQQDYIKIIQKSGDRMLNTVNDIIDISKIEAGQMTLAFSEVNVAEKLENLYSFFKPEAEKKGIQFDLKNKLSEQECIVQTDKEKLNSILTNLVKNAIKFSDRGAIEFGVELKSDNKTQVFEFYVKDSGVGIPYERQQAIFERFVQADIEDKYARQGSGLGLAISKAYIEMLGGRIWVESKSGEGSVFCFTLPCGVNSQKKDKIKELVDVVDKNSNEIKKLNIVIAEDEEDSAKLLEILLQPIAKNIQQTVTGTDTVELCRNNPEIDLIFMDIKMPETNGLDATRQIRQFNKNVVIIAQTAFALAGDKEKAMEAGCNDYITKPIRSNEIHRLIQYYFEPKNKNDVH